MSEETAQYFDSIESQMRLLDQMMGLPSSTASMEETNEQAEPTAEQDPYILTRPQAEEILRPYQRLDPRPGSVHLDLNAMPNNQNWGPGQISNWMATTGVSFTTTATGTSGIYTINPQQYQITVDPITRNYQYIYPAQEPDGDQIEIGPASPFNFFTNCKLIKDEQKA